MNGMVISSIELCAGVGMLGEGVRAAFEFLGWQHRTVAYVERESAAAAQLVTLMEAECLDAAPVYSDLLTFNGRAMRGKVDCLVAGFPCQDLSVAGKRVGLNGSRSGLFFNILDIADDSGAWLLILENVAGIASATATVMDKAAAADITGERYRPRNGDVGSEDGAVLERAAARVLGELADRGWNAEWITLSASDVGASHKRERWFCIAWRMADTESERRGEAGECCRETVPGIGIASPALANPAQFGRGERWAESERKQGRLNAAECDCALADAKRNSEQNSMQQPADGSRQDGQRKTDQLGGGSTLLADTSGTGCQGREQCRACTCDRGGGASTWIN